MEITFVILAATIALFVINRLRPDLVALLSLISLYIAGVVDLKQAFSGFSDSVVVMVAGLFVVSEGLTATRVTAWMGQRLFTLAGRSELRLMVLVIGFTAFLSAFISNTGTTAILMPVVIAAAWRIGSYPSRLLLPMAFAANLGGMLTLIGTPPNIVVTDYLAGAGLEPFGFFEFTVIGLPVLILLSLFITTIGRRILPVHASVARIPDLDSSIGDLAGSYSLKGYLYRLRVGPDSLLSGKSLKETQFGGDYGVNVLGIERPVRSFGRTLMRKIVPEPRTVIEAGDWLVANGNGTDIDRAGSHFCLEMDSQNPIDENIPALLLNSEAGLAEIIIAPRSEYAGQTLEESRFSEKNKLQVVSIRRNGRVLPDRKSRIRFGDSLLVRGTWAAVEKIRGEERNFVVVGNPEIMARQVVELTPKSVVAVLILAAMVAAMASGVLPPAVAVLCAATGMVLTGCVPMDRAYGSIGWQTVMILAALLPMGSALQTTGGALFIADGLVKSIGALGNLPLLACIYLLTAGLSQVISNTATAVLMSPIVLQSCASLGVSPYPFMMMVALGASSAFLTPISTPVNTLVFGPGGYSFGDYAKNGIPLLVIAMAAGLVLIPWIWPF